MPVAAERPNLAAMHSFRRIVTLLVLSLTLVAVASPAMATESQTETDPGTTETTVPTEPTFVDGDEPALVIPPEAVVEELEQPWTSRYIYPTIVVVTILLIIGLVWGYFHFIRNRYTVVSDT
jgi:hypothetical protein